MDTLMWILVGGGIITAVLSLMGKCPAGVSCLLLGVAVAIQVLR
jgi:hypothetical protein